jgi:CheY-like chemotaxis protein
VGAGAGLGLSVSHGIITQLDGRLWVESVPGAGATFHIELPISKNGAFAGATTAVAPTRSARVDKPCILIIDDELDLRTILAKRLATQEYLVDLAGSGEEAWLKLKQTRYDCILMDLRMPGLGGEELYGWIVGRDPEMAAKVIFMTGDTMNPGTKFFLDSVPNLVLAKPFTFSEINQLVTTIIPPAC